MHALAVFILHFFSFNSKMILWKYMFTTTRRETIQGQQNSNTFVQRYNFSISTDIKITLERDSFFFTTSSQVFQTIRRFC